MRANLPYEKVGQVRQKNSRLGLGLMGVHEWLLTRDYRYEMVDELRKWMKVYESESKRSADAHCKQFYLNCPQGYRAIAPTGTISIIAGTTGGLEPIHSVAYRRRYLVDGTKWNYEYVIDGAAQTLIDKGIDKDKIETSMDLAQDVERRVKFQYEMQKHVDHAVSSTINLPAWGSEFNNEDLVEPFSKIIRKYGHGLRGLTFYPDGSRGGQPIQAVPYDEAHAKRNVVYEDHSNEQCLSGVCNI
jgi:ribonucleoside-diphosphate reductase alpha chain